MMIAQPHSTGKANRPRRGRAVAAGVVLAAGLAAVAALILTRGGSGQEPHHGGAHNGGEAHTGDVAAESCVETYSLDTLRQREFAFDGTVVAADGDTATLAVNRWFRGDRGKTVTLEGFVPEGVESSADSPTASVGSRLLVSGEDRFAWACGFTKPYDQQLAAQWAEALGS